MLQHPRRLPARLPARLLAAAMIALALAGCGLAPLDGDRPTAQRPEGAFAGALFQDYVDLGNMEHAEYDWQDAAGFYRRADAVAAGDRVEPEALDARDLPAAELPVLAAARERLMRAFAGGARALTPEAAAHAQGGFDCWMQELEENLQPDHIAACRERFETAMAEVERSLTGALVVLLTDADGAVGAVELSNAEGTVALTSALASAVAPGPGAAPDATGRLTRQDVTELFAGALAAAPPPPVTLRLYFEPGTDRLTPESEASLPRVRELIRERTVPGVEVAGHTDRTGSPAVNDRLALRRAQAIGELLRELGVPPRMLRIDSFGERDPVVPTADGVDEPRNRRVEITVR